MRERALTEVLPPTLVKEDEALPETADSDRTLTVCGADVGIREMMRSWDRAEHEVRRDLQRFVALSPRVHSSARSEVGREVEASSCRTFATPPTLGDFGERHSWELDHPEILCSVGSAGGFQCPSSKPHPI
jgi:hypothetical protein